MIRVPLLVKPPKGTALDPGITDSLAELVDFYATAMDFAGVEPAGDHFGKSLRPVLADRSVSLREYAFCEGGRLPHEEQCDEYHAAAGKGGVIPTASLYWPRQMAQTDDRAHAKGTMVRDRRFKYIHRTSGEHELYDLERDPLEEENLYGREDLARETARLRMAMLDWYQATCDVVPRQYDRRISPELLWEKLRSQCPPGAEEEIRGMIFAGAGPAMINARLGALRREKERRGVSQE